MSFKFRKRKILSVNTNEFVECKYLFMYRRKYNQSESNPLYDKNSREVNLVQFGNKDMIEKYSRVFDILLPDECIIIPMVSEYSSRDTFLNISILVSEICFKNNKRINGYKTIIRTKYHDNIKDFYKETISSDILVHQKEIYTLEDKNIIIFTDVINNNISGYLTYRNIIRNYNPRSVELVGLARYVET